MARSHPLSKRASSTHSFSLQAKAGDIGPGELGGSNKLKLKLCRASWHVTAVCLQGTICGKESPQIDSEGVRSAENPTTADTGEMSCVTLKHCSQQPCKELGIKTPHRLSEPRPISKRQKAGDASMLRVTLVKIQPWIFSSQCQDHLHLRRQQRLPSGNKSQQHADHQQGGTKHNRDHQKLYQGGQAPHSSGRTGHHGYSQNRRWHHNQKHSPNDKETHRNAKETENLKIEDSSVCTAHVPAEAPRGPEAVEKQSQQSIPEPETKRKDSVHERAGDRPKINLLQSSKDRLRRRLKEKTPCLSLFTDQDEVTVETTDPEKNKMDKLIEILNSMRNNSSDVDSKLTTFMEEAQNSTNSEEMLGEIVKTIYQKAVTDRSFASTAAKLCDKMALFMVEGTKFRSLLLNMLQKDFSMREELQQRDVERWLGFITFLCEVFGTMRSSTGEPFRVLVCPIYTCLRELLQSQDVKEDAVLCCSMELQSTGRLLEEQLPEMMTELLAIARDKMLCPSESMLTRSLLLEVIELHANNWNPLMPTITQYYNKTIQKLTA
ncbi:hypothetical protein IHE44_0011734 [Lamprotornis superbus]|uniref:CBP80/20-dependent translation initiation factor n=1 Tax=Lamprotornis superbus TaxID=245042 RepID=A0A835TQU6_9PASS|nr:hypothetical protein IHE44_0011734 [Lamprotornis superbus]